MYRHFVCAGYESKELDFWNLSLFLDYEGKGAKGADWCNETSALRKIAEPTVILAPAALLPLQSA